MGISGLFVMRIRNLTVSTIELWLRVAQLFGYRYRYRIHPKHQQPEAARGEGSRYLASTVAERQADTTGR
jgi:hypothetical protein